MKIVMGLCFLPVIFIIYFTVIYSAKSRKNYLLGVSCVNDYFTKEELAQYLKSFKKELNIWLIVLLLLFGAISFIPKDYVYLSVLMLWLIPSMFCFFIPFARGFKKLSTEKKRRLAMNGEETSAIPVDLTAASTVYHTGLIKYGWIGTWIGFIPVILSFIVPIDSKITILYPLLFGTMWVVNLSLIFLMYWFEHKKTEVISSKTEENITYTKIEVYEWNRLLTAFIWLTSIYNLILFASFTFETLFWGLIIGTFVYCVVLFYFTIKAMITIRNKQSKFDISSPYSVDDDKYWIWGMIYYNKNDSHLMISKRDKMGTTINLAKTSGKILYAIVGVIIFASTIGCAIWILMEGIYRPNLQIEENSFVASHISEEYNIPISSIEEVTLLDTLPRTRKDVGSAMDELYKGSFRVTDIGRCELLLNPKTKAYILIETSNEDLYIFNEDSLENTIQIYEQLEAQLNHSSTTN